MQPTSSDTELIREALDWVAAGDIGRLSEIIDPQIEIENVMTGRSLRGGEAAMRAIRRWLEGGKGWKTAGVRCEELAGRVLVTGHVDSESALGSPISLPVTWLLTVREGQISRTEIFANERHARRAVD